MRAVRFSNLLFVFLLSLLIGVRSAEEAEVPPPCGCIRASGSNECFKYDPVVQAPTLGDAVLTFADPTVSDEEEQRPLDDDDNPAPGAHATPAGSRRCVGPQCRRCVRDFVNHFRRINLGSAAQRRRVDALLRSLNVTTSAARTDERRRAQRRERPVGCRRYRFLRKPTRLPVQKTARVQSDPPSPGRRGQPNRDHRSREDGTSGQRGKGRPDRRWEDRKRIGFRPDGEHRSRARERPQPNGCAPCPYIPTTTPPTTTTTQNANPFCFPPKPKTKRRLPASTPSLGVTWQINCVERGAQDEAKTSVSLCSMCWQWRVLPSDYYPRYINELVCASDTRCLSGYGTCEPRLKTLSVLKKENGGYTQVSVTATTSCECMIEIGSPLNNFVKA